MALIQNTEANTDVNTIISSKGTQGSFFKDGVETFIVSAPKEGHSLDIIILPSFDMDKGPSEFKRSYTAYREQNSDRLDPVTKTPAFTHWAKACKGYTFFGNQRLNFVSPLTGKAYKAVKSKKDGKVRLYPPAHIDPIVDIANYIWFNPDEVGKATADLIKPDENKRQKFPRAPRSFIISNALVSVDKEPWQFKVIAYSEMAYRDLIGMLAWPTPRSAQPVSSEFEDFLFGDITSPTTGSILSVSLKETTGGPAFAGFNISDDNRTLNGRRPVGNLITEDVLNKRVVLNDTDYIDVWSYQRIVDMLVEDKMIPINVIKKAVNQGTIFNVPTIKDTIEPDDTSEPDFEARPIAPKVQTNNIPLASDQPQSTVQEPQAIVQDDAKQKALANDPELPEYKRLCKIVVDGSANSDEVMRFMQLQSKFGVVSQYA